MWGIEVVNLFGLKPTCSPSYTTPQTPVSTHAHESITRTGRCHTRHEAPSRLPDGGLGADKTACPLSEQASYELRPVELFGRTPVERARQTTTATRTLRWKVQRFDETGMAGLFDAVKDPSEHGPQQATSASGRCWRPDGSAPSSARPRQRDRRWRSPCR